MRPAVRASLRPWPLDAGIVHLVLLDVEMVPTATDVDGWVNKAFDDAAPDVRRVRTGAMFPRSAEAFLERGFEIADRLALLDRNLTGARQPPRVHPVNELSVTRLRQRDLPAAADLDQIAFPDGWGHDVDSLGDIASATPQVRQRIAHSSRRTGRRTIGFSITGKAGTVGYLQRIAVHPDARRHGVARVLVDDAVGWLMRRGAARVLVNTGVDNQAALALYSAAGFELLPDELLVLELERPR
jgi:ribosomal-protein-alanine N-acetyltransferase